MNEIYNFAKEGVGAQILNKSWMDKPIAGHLLNVCEKFPDKIAVKDQGASYSYYELLKIVSGIANRIADFDSVNSPVIIYLDNEPNFIFSMLASLVSGKGYLPLDINFPAGRNKEIVAHSQAKLIISKPEFVKELDISGDLIFIDIDEAIKSGSSSITIKENTSDQLAYILYTSGSTGKPKGVYQNQRNLLHDVMQYINAINLSPDDHSSLLYSPSVNGAIRDIYGTLLSGATLHMNNLRKNGLLSLPEFITGNQITIYHSIPAIFRSGLSKNQTYEFPSVRLIYLAGDKIFDSDIDLYRRHFPDTCVVYIGIGSTENATIYRQWFLNKETRVEPGIVPVGFEVDDRYMRLLDEGGQEVQHGEIGEIYVDSAHCALGYWNDEALTKSSFLVNQHGSRTVRTGDWGLVNEYGLLEFKGRRDGQIKINGNRIEVAEVEAAISAIDGVENSAVVIRQQDANASLVAYLQLSGNSTLDIIKQRLSKRLTQSMFPSKFYVLDEIPRLGNFKIDVQVLRQIDKANMTSENELKTDLGKPHVGEGHYIKERLLSVWCEYASYESFRKNQSWKFGGGSSLEAVHFHVNIEQEFGISVPNDWISSEMIPMDIVRKISEQLVHGGSENKKGDEEQDDQIHIYVFIPFYGSTTEQQLYFRELARAAPLTLVRYPHFESWELKDISFDSICDEIDLAQFTKGQKKLFIGICMGSPVAFRTISRFNKLGQLDGLNLIVLDYPIQNEAIFLRRIVNLVLKFFDLPLLQAITDTQRWISRRLEFGNGTNGNSIAFNLPDNNGNWHLIELEKMKRLNAIIAKIVSRQRYFDFVPIAIYLFTSRSKWTVRQDYGWKKYVDKVSFIKMDVEHSDIFRNPDNLQLLINLTLEVLGEIKSGERRHTAV